MKRALSTAAIVFLGLVASPFLLFGILLVLAGVLGLVLAGVGLIAFVLTWLIPIVLILLITGAIAWAISLLIERW